MVEKTILSFESENFETGETIKGTIEGTSEMSFWKHDLKFKAVLSLLEDINSKDFYEDNKHELFQKYIDEVQDTLNFIKD